ncbi:hypothetical protein Dip510_000064 [Elusimicrobium posterum]|uniref:hypothetical protein n=1 Tax=Elusimicrobium posterum TaxID=3116653 RepID=UPI003C7694BD
MTKVIKATAQNGKVFTEGKEVPAAHILSAGAAPSNGVLILNNLEKVYIAMPMQSIESLIDAVADLATAVGDNVETANSGGPVAPTLKAAMQKAVQELNELKGKLQ